LAGLCLDAGLGVVFVGAAQETFAKPRLAELLHPRLIDAIGRMTLPVLVDTLRGAACVVTNDTGPGHLALGVGTPTVMIAGGGHYGAFVPYPEEIRPEGAIFLSHPMECYHCLWRCPLRADSAAPFPCVGMVSVDAVWRAVRALTLAGEPLPAL
jgi:ADP-heptose:LPS heptosyltransferase